MVIWHTACLRKPYGANRLCTATEAVIMRYQAVLWAEATGTGTGCLGESWCRWYRVGYAMPVLLLKPLRLCVSSGALGSREIGERLMGLGEFAAHAQALKTVNGFSEGCAGGGEVAAQGVEAGDHGLKECKVFVILITHSFRSNLFQKPCRLIIKPLIKGNLGEPYLDTDD